MDKVLAVRNEYREQQWALVIKECADSGLTNKEYCRQHGISEKSYYYWLRKLRKQVCEQAAPQIVSIDPVAKTDELLRIEYKGAELKLPTDVDMNAVAAILHSLQSL